MERRKEEADIAKIEPFVRRKGAEEREGGVADASPRTAGAPANSKTYCMSFSLHNQAASKKLEYCDKRHVDTREIIIQKHVHCTEITVRLFVDQPKDKAITVDTCEH